MSEIIYFKKRSWLVNTLFLMLSLFIPHFLLGVGSVITGVGNIDAETDYSLYYDHQYKIGSVRFRFYQKGNKYPIKEERYSIKNVTINGADPVLIKNNLTVKIDKGTFFIPKMGSKDSALFQGSPITIMRANDIMRAASSSSLK